MGAAAGAASSTIGAGGACGAGRTAGMAGAGASSTTGGVGVAGGLVGAGRAVGWICAAVGCGGAFCFIGWAGSRVAIMRRKAMTRAPAITNGILTFGFAPSGLGSIQVGFFNLLGIAPPPQVDPDRLGTRLPDVEMLIDARKVGRNRRGVEV